MMLSQIRQISEGRFNTVFVKNKEQKFNLDKEIHDIECWKQSRNHVYRKEERELLAHLEKLRLQQENLHHLDVDRELYHLRRGSQSADTVHGVEGLHGRESQESNHDSISASTSGTDNQELPLTSNSLGSPVLPKQVQSPVNPGVMLPPVQSFTDQRTLRRTDAHTNICVICQLPRRLSVKYGHHHSSETACCCCEDEGTESTDESRSRRFTVGGHEEHSSRPAPIQVGQRRHSLMMARLNDEKYEYKPHPPERSHGGNSRNSHHNLTTARRNHKDDSYVHVHHSHDHHGHVHDHHGHVHGHHGNVHHHNHETHAHTYSANGHSSGTQTHGNGHQRHHRHGIQNGDIIHTPNNSPLKSPHHSINPQGHHNPPMSRHEPLYSAYHSAERTTANGNHKPDLHHSGIRRTSYAASHVASLGTGVQDPYNDSRQRDHELHWDRHQVYKLRGMITDPHYKEQLEVERRKSYPWSPQYETTKTGRNDIEDLKNCRYLRFSKLNLESMTENPDEEVEVFEKKLKDPPL